MALPIKDYLAGTAVDQAMRTARILRDNVIGWKARVDAGTTADIVLNSMNGIKQARDQLAQIAATPGLAAYAKTEFNDNALNFVAELNAIVAACDACVSWVATNFPRDANGYLLREKIVNGQLEQRALTGAGLSAYSTQLATLLNAFS
jgi:hypothetical protein